MLPPWSPTPNAPPRCHDPGGRAGARWQRRPPTQPYVGAPRALVLAGVRSVHGAMRVRNSPRIAAASSLEIGCWDTRCTGGTLQLDFNARELTIKLVYYG